MPPAIGQKARGLEDLRGVDGKSYSLASFKDKKALVVIFSGNACPTAKATDPRIIAIQRDYARKGVQVVMINSNNSSISPTDTMAGMMSRARDSGYNFPYLKDSGHKAARGFGAMTTPHAFILDGERRIRYRGRIDNARELSRVTVNDLREALDDLLSGRAVRNPDNTPLGCSIVW